MNGIQNINSTDIVSSSPSLLNANFALLATAFNIKGYGAVGDGITDDSAAISAAGQAASNEGGGIILIPNSTFKVLSSPTLYSNCIYLGLGTCSVISLGAGVRFDVSNLTNIIFRDFEINGSSQVVGNYGIYMDGSTDISITGMRLLAMGGFGIFVNASGSNHTQRILISECYLQGTGNNDVIGGGPNNNTGALVSDVTISTNTIRQDNTVNTYDGCIDIVAAHNVSIVGNNCYGSIGFGEEAFPNLENLISNNRVQPALGKADAKIFVYSTTTATTSGSSVGIIGNILTSAYIEVDGIAGFPVLNVNVIGNTIQCTAFDNGIGLTYVSGGLVCGNAVIGPTAGVILNNSSNLIVVSNSFTNTTYGIRDTTGNTTIRVQMNQYNNVTTHIVGGSDWFGVGTQTPQKHIQVQEPSGSGVNPGVRISQDSAGAGIDIYESNGVGDVYFDSRYDSAFTRMNFRLRSLGTPLNIMTLYGNGNVGLGSVTTPTASLHFPAGTASNAPLKLSSGTNLSSAADGAFEYDGTHLYFTIGSTRHTLV